MTEIEREVTMRTSHFVGIIVGALLAAALAANRADAGQSLTRSCLQSLCPEGYRHSYDIHNWSLLCGQYVNNTFASQNHYWRCDEETGSVTSDQGYGVSPNYVCWKGCMKGRSGAMADKAICTAKCKNVPH
jgi:hypothetical protein